MPGSIRVSVLEAVDLPEALKDGTAEKDVTVKVVLGQREYKTEPANVDGGKTAPWNSDFAFPVTNLRDKLIVAVCNNEDQNVTQTTIEIPSIIEKGFRDEFVLLKGGGQIHLKLSFVLTDEERKKIEMMRVAALKRREEALKKKREEERLKKTVVFQTLQPTSIENNPKPPSRVTITEIDDTTTDGKEQASKENASVAPLGFGPTAKPLKPKPLFDYAKAVGVKPGRNIKRKTERPITTRASTPSTKIVKTDNVKTHTAKQANGQNSTSTLGTERQPESRAGQSPPAMSSHENVSTRSVPPSLQGPHVGRVPPGIVKSRVTALEGTLPQEVDESTLPATELQEEKWQVEGQRARDMLEAEATAMADSLREREDEPRGKRRVNLNTVNLKQHLQRLEGQVRYRSKAGNGQQDLGTPETSNKTCNPQKSYKRSPGQPISVSELHQLATSEIQEEAMKQMESHKDFPSKVWQALSAVADEQNCRPGQYRSESRSVGPEARWAHKTNLESRWASPEKARRMVRDEWSGQVADPFRARAKILELFKAAAGSNESFGDDQSFQHHSLAGSIGVVVNKVVGGAAMLLAALFMLWPLGEGSPDRGDAPFGDDRAMIRTRFIMASESASSRTKPRLYRSLKSRSALTSNILLLLEEATMHRDLRQAQSSRKCL